MKTSPIITEFDPPRNIIHGRFPAEVGGTVDKLVLQRPIHRFRQGIIVAYPSAADGSPDPEVLQYLAELR
jgi:hypothetical protein